MPSNRQVNINTESVDNYLKAILGLSGPQEQSVSSTALAQRLAVAPASITNMLQKLASARPPFVEYEKHRGVRLSPQGKRRALEIVRHHRLIETFLYEVLGYPIEEVHDEAERLEHFISERFEQRIDAKLGHPKFDPHGHCIPGLDGKMVKEASKPLSDIEKDGEVIVDSVSDQDATLLKQLRAHGIAPGTRLRVNKLPQEFVLRAQNGSKPMHLPRSVADAVRVRSTK